MAALDLSVLETGPLTLRHPPDRSDALRGRAAERAFLEAHADGLKGSRPSLVMVGEAGIGKSTLWRYGVSRCRAAGARVLECRAAQEDQELAGQGLHDLFGADGLAPDLTVTERSRALLERLGALVADAPVVLAVDDVGWLDDLTLRVLRFCLRRLPQVSVLATACTWSAVAPDRAVTVPDLGVQVDRLEIAPMPPGEIAEIIAHASPGLPLPQLTEIARLAHGNPLFALELARSGRTYPGCSTSGITLLDALRERLDTLPEQARAVARLLAVGGPASIPELRAAVGSDDLERVLHAGLRSDTFTIGEDFVVRFAHPLLGAAALDGITPLERRRVHAALALAVDDPDARALHLARAAIEADGAIATELEDAACRLSRRGAPRLAADLLADSVRLTPSGDVATRTGRALARIRACATAGELDTALTLAEQLLAELPAGPLRAEVISCRVELDVTDAEQFLRATLAELTEDGTAESDLLRGRLLSMLGWLLALHLARIPEGLTMAREGLAAGRRHGDPLLTAQAASTVSTAALMAGEREDALIEEAVALDADVPASHLVMWPRVLLGRQLLWDGRLADARHHQEAMYRRTLALGADLQRSYRLCDLAQIELAAGQLDLVAAYVEDGLEVAAAAADRRAATWLAYPAGLVAALREEPEDASLHAELLEGWSSRVGERPRSAMAAHIRGTLAASRRDWDGALRHLLTGVDVLDDLQVAHPGVVPVLPQALVCAVLGEDQGMLDPLVERLQRAAAALRAPWVAAHARAGLGMQQWLREEPAALDTLLESWSVLSGLGHRLDAARLGCVVAAAGLRWGQRRRVRAVADDSAATFARERVSGWDALAAELRDRVAGSRGTEALTTTETQIADLVVAGRRNREIAADLFVSESTVEAHLTRVYRKLGLRNRAELIRTLRAAS